MIFCQNCGHPNQDGDTYCQQCGTLLDKSQMPAPPKPAPGPTAIPKSKLARSRLFWIAAAECLLAVILAFAFFQIGQSKTSSKAVAQSYFEAVVSQDWSKAYSLLDLPEAQGWLDETMYLAVHDQKSQSLQISSASWSADASQGSGRITYTVTYYVKDQSAAQSESITLVKTGNKRYFFFDEWKVSDPDSIVSNAMFMIPLDSELTIEGKSAAEYETADEEGDHLSVTIPYLFAGDYTMSVSASGLETFEGALSVAQGYISPSTVTLHPDAQTLTDIKEQAAQNVASILAAACNQEDFSKVSSLFADAQTAKTQYSDLVETLSEKKIASLELSDFRASIGYSSDSWKVEVYLIVPRNEVSYPYGSKRTRTSSVSFLMTYVYTDGAWKLESLPFSGSEF